MILWILVRGDDWKLADSANTMIHIGAADVALNGAWTRTSTVLRKSTYTMCAGNVARRCLEDEFIE